MRHRGGTNEQQNSRNSGVVKEGAEERVRRKEAVLLKEEAQCSPRIAWAGVGTPLSSSVPDLGLVICKHSGSDSVSLPADAHVRSLISSAY